jgi:phosphoglycolate phosphatase
LAPRRFDAVVFDFDYTLVDSSRAVIACANYALDQLGLPLASDEAICRTIGLPLPEVLVELAGERERGRGREFQRQFVSLSDKVGNPLTVLLEPTAEAIKALKTCGLRLGIVSTKMRYRMEGLLRREGLLADFDVIVGVEDVPAPKPDPTGLLMAMERLVVARQDCLYVGDSVVDAETAQRAEVPFLAVLTGTTERLAFSAYPNVGIAGSIAEVPGIVGCGQERERGTI